MDSKRFKVVPAGRRAGKSEIAKRKLVSLLPIIKEWQDARYFAAAPTNAQAKRVFWKDLKALTPKGWVKRVYETDLCISTIFGSELWVVGMDKPQRIEGVAWDGGVLDEYANMKETAWSENVRPALSDRRGWCWFIGVPEGFNHYKDLADYAASGIDEDWGLYTWRSADILDGDEIDAARRHLDPRTFRQEYEASFEGASGRVYYAYDQKLHSDATIELDGASPIIVCCDFNVDPCLWILCQSDGKEVRVFDEIALGPTGTAAMAKELRSRYGGHAAGFIIYGDAAGRARSTTGKSDYAILSEFGFRDQRVRSSNPRVKDRVNAVNSILCNSSGEVRLSHHPRCRYLKRDFETVSWSATGTEIDKRSRDRTHATDALGYYVASEFPLRLLRAVKGKRFYK
ncbi:Phage terminase [hydrothermal vent metagenome]|uniref:Phage terminase n=1 Tax=hydrothermal vent metagenome TaxID=652676 RepID=A0A3B0QRY4_9ZZZZ